MTLRLLLYRDDLLGLRLLLLLLFAFLYTSYGVLLLPLLLLLVLRDALFDVGLEGAALIDWKLSQLKRHLVVDVTQSELGHDFNDTLRLLLVER